MSEGKTRLFFSGLPDAPSTYPGSYIVVSNSPILRFWGGDALEVAFDDKGSPDALYLVPIADSLPGARIVVTFDPFWGQLRTCVDKHVPVSLCVFSGDVFEAEAPVLPATAVLRGALYGSHEEYLEVWKRIHNQRV